jgi:hypothetical protein
MVRVRHIRRPQLGHNRFELRLSPSMVEIVTSKADDAVMAVTVNKFLAETASKRCDPYDLFSKLLRIENPGLMGTFHGRCSCAASSAGGGAGKTAQREGRTLRGICHQRVNEFHRICHYGIAREYEARPTPLACIDPRIIGNHLAILPFGGAAIERARLNMFATPCRVPTMLVSRDHRPARRCHFTLMHPVSSDASRRPLRRLGKTYVWASMKRRWSDLLDRRLLTMHCLSAR